MSRVGPTIAGVRRPLVLAGLAALVVGAAAPVVVRRAGSWTRASAPGRFATAVDATGFLRGNLHTHTSLSDGDRPPEEVIAWYREHGYAFVALTDHDLRNDPVGADAEGGTGF